MYDLPPRRRISLISVKLGPAHSCLVCDLVSQLRKLAHSGARLKVPRRTERVASLKGEYIKRIMKHRITALSIAHAQTILYK